MSCKKSEPATLEEALRVLRLIAEQGGDIVEPWSAEMARRALETIQSETVEVPGPGCGGCRRFGCND